MLTNNQVGLRYAFTNQHSLFVVLDLMTGGDLSYHLRQSRFVSFENSQNSGNLQVSRKTLGEIFYYCHPPQVLAVVVVVVAMVRLMACFVATHFM
jgi:hypothetical protein